MDSTVKAAMLKSSQAMVLNPPTTTTTTTTTSPPLTPRAGVLRKVRSSESLGSPKQLKGPMEYDFPQPPQTAGMASHASSLGAPYLPSGHTRGASFDVPQTFSRSQIHLAAGELVPNKTSKGSALAKNISPTKFFSILSGTSSTQLDVENVKKLRLLLRNESARCRIFKFYSFNRSYLPAVGLRNFSS